MWKRRIYMCTFINELVYMNEKTNPLLDFCVDAARSNKSAIRAGQTVGGK